MTGWQRVDFIPLSGRNYSEDAYFANDLNREYCPYGQVRISYTPYYTALLPDIQVHCSIGSLGISALTVGMRSTDWLKVSLSGNDVCAYEAVHLFHFWTVLEISTIHFLNRGTNN